MNEWLNLASDLRYFASLAEKASEGNEEAKRCLAIYFDGWHVEASVSCGIANELREWCQRIDLEAMSRQLKPSEPPT